MADANLSVAPAGVGLIRGGAGKSTLMRMVYGNYLAAAGSIVIAGTDITKATRREIIALRRATLGYVSQFLRVVPRVPTLDVAAEPLLTLGHPLAEGRGRGRRPCCGR